MPFHMQLFAESFGPWMAVILVYVGVGQSFALPRCFTFALASLILLATLLIPLVPSVFGRAVFTSACFLPMLWYGAEAIWEQEPEWDGKAAAIDATAEHWQTGDVLVVRHINDVNILLYHATAAGIDDFDVRCLVGPFKSRTDGSIGCTWHR
jgi:hypothetical protein